MFLNTVAWWNLSPRSSSGCSWQGQIRNQGHDGDAWIVHSWIDVVCANSINFVSVQTVCNPQLLLVVAQFPLPSLDTRHLAWAVSPGFHVVVHTQISLPDRNWNAPSLLHSYFAVLIEANSAGVV